MFDAREVGCANNFLFHASYSCYLNVSFDTKHIKVITVSQSLYTWDKMKPNGYTVVEISMHMVRSILNKWLSLWNCQYCYKESFSAIHLPLPQQHVNDTH